MRRNVAEAAVIAAPCRIPPAQAGEPDVATRHEPHPVMTAAPEPPRRQVPHVVDEGTAVPSGVTASLGSNLGVHRDREARGPVSIRSDLEPTLAQPQDDEGTEPILREPEGGIHHVAGTGG